MASTLARSKAALTSALKQTLSQDRVDAFVGGTHTADLEDNLVATIDARQTEVLRRQLMGGSGGELTTTKTGKRRAHAPYSSAMLAFNAFGGWLGREADLTVAGLSGWTQQLLLEAQLQIAHGGGLANLDVLLESPELALGVESKLTEHVAPHQPTPWRAPYFKPEIAVLLPAGWQRVLKALLAGDWRPEHLHAEQLVKHALALHCQRPDHSRALLYVYWEPTNAGAFPEFAAHHAELDRMRDYLGDDADPLFVSRSHAELFEEWSVAGDDWAREHVLALRGRYEVEV